MNLRKSGHFRAGNVQKMKMKSPEGEIFRRQKRDGLPLKKEAIFERSKKLKKFIDDSTAIFSLAETSADASRYLMCGKGGWPHEPTELVALKWREQSAESLKTKEIRANENDTESI